MDDDTLPSDNWDEGIDIIPWILDDLKNFSSTPGSKPAKGDSDNERLQHSKRDQSVVRAGDILEFHLSNGKVIGNGEYWRSLSMPLRLWYPVIRNQATGTGWKVHSEIQPTTKHTISYGSTIQLLSTESEVENQTLCAWFSTYVYSTTYDPTWSQCYEWRIMSANDGEISPQSDVRYGDKVLLMNVYYRLFLTIDDNRFLSIKSRSEAAVFTLRLHYRLAAIQIEELQKEKLKLEEEKLLIQKQKAEADLKNEQLQEDNEKNKQQLLEDKLQLLECHRREEQILEEKVVLEKERKRAQKEIRIAEKKINDINELKLCVVCMERDRAIRFEPCGHVCCCQECGSELSSCPMDNQAIEKQQKAYAYV